MKVLYLIDTLEVGGAEKSLLTITSAFKNVIPVFVYIYPGNSLEKKFIENEIEVHFLGIESGYNFSNALKKLLPLVKVINPDIIHSTLFKSDIIARRLIKHYPKPLINSLVNNSYAKSRFRNLPLVGKIKLYLVQQYDAKTAKNVDLFISNSQAIKITNSFALSIPESKIKVIHRGRDSSIFENFSKIDLKNISNEIDFKGRKIFLNVSRLLERKGQLDLLKAFNLLGKDRDDLLLLIAGEGEYRGVLEKYILDNDLKGKVLLLGNRNDIPLLLKSADYFIFPSWYEGLPGALIEAMMSGTPIIASDIPENRECVSSESALIFKKASINSLFQSIKWALTHEKEMKNKSSKAIHISKEKFEISRIVMEYESAYKELLERQLPIPTNKL